MKELLQRLLRHETLTRPEAHEVMGGIAEGKYNETQITALLTILTLRGVTVDELIGFREALLEACVPIDLTPYQPIDIVGTGGDGKNTFNISTCACFVVAGAGYHVAKHGNFGATSVSGASNVIQNHGVRFTNEADRLKRSIEECGIAYMHAPLFHPAMKNVAGVRRNLQLRTVFNLLGPLINPCRPAHQLLGVADLSLMRLYTHTLKQLGIRFAVVTSLDGYDEISLTHEFKITTNRYETIYTPEELELPRNGAQALSGGNTPEEAAQIFDAILENRATPDQKSCVVANAAFAIQTIEQDKSLKECLAIARESIDSGRAKQALHKFIEINA